MKIFNKLVRPLCLQKAKKITSHCGKYVKGNVLDVGAGRCYIARELKEKYKIKPTCIDVDDLNETDLKLIVYDGKRIPYKNNKFDTVLLVYVLHHCENPINVLKECKRVCKKNGKIIIFEDFGFIFLTYIMDWIANKMHNVDAPLNFKSYDEWMKIFEALNLRLLYCEDSVEKQFFYPFVEHKMYVLRVNK